MVGSNVFRVRLMNVYLPLSAFLIFLLFPFYWMLIVSSNRPRIFLTWG